MKRDRWVFWFMWSGVFFGLAILVVLFAPNVEGRSRAAAAMGLGTAASVCLARGGWAAGWRGFP
jgi:hypothetical protein